MNVEERNGPCSHDRLLVKQKQRGPWWPPGFTWTASSVNGW